MRYLPLIAALLSLAAACGPVDVEQLDAGATCLPDWSWCLRSTPDAGVEIYGAP